MSGGRVLLLIVVLVAFATSSNAQFSFNIETVYSDDEAGVSASLVLDVQDQPHIAHIVASNHELLYTTKIGTSWESETAHARADPLSGTVLVLANGRPGVTNAGQFFIRTASGWDGDNMGGFSPWFSTIATDGDGGVHGVFQWSWGSGVYQGFVDYGERLETGWSNDPIAGALFLPTKPHGSLVIDANGDPHVSASVTEGDPLRYWYRQNNVWSEDVLAPGTWSSIALNDQGEPGISFYDSVNGDLMFATRAGGIWTTEPVDQTGDVGLYTSLVLRDGVGHITYYDKSSGDLKYAVSVQQGWTIQRVDTDGDVGAWTSLALDTQGNPHIAYQDVSNGDLEYAVGAATVPTEERTAGGIKWLFRGDE